MLRSYRHGFATNSSSSHSIILHPRAPEGIYTPTRPWSTGEAPARYDHYSLIHAADKAGYLAQALTAFWKTQPAASAHGMLEIMEAFSAHGLSFADLAARPVDIERAFGSLPAPDGVPFAHWLRFLLDPRVSFHVRPEGDCGDSPLQASLGIATGAHNGDVVSVPYHQSPTTRWKVDGEALVGFDHYDGTKMRWSPRPYEKSTTPELVDVKITDWCGFGCSFCYQGSTPQGAHAPLGSILSLFDQLAAMGVFEVALGGGEPLAHPDIAAITQGAVERGLCVALTSYDKGLDRHPATIPVLSARDAQKDHDWSAYSARFTALGISVHGPRDVERLARTRHALEEARLYPEMVAQTVVGATPMATLERTLDTAIALDIPLLLLGYKTTGRGAGRERAVNAATLERVLRKARRAIDAETAALGQGFRLGVDTAFLDAHGDLLDRLGIPQVMRSSPEGKFSMYVDAVAGTCGPSSYCDAALMEPVGDLVAQFAQW